MFDYFMKKKGEFEMGEPIDFTFTGDVVNVFDKETGVNIGV